MCQASGSLNTAYTPSPSKNTSTMTANNSGAAQQTQSTNSKRPRKAPKSANLQRQQENRTPAPTSQSGQTKVDLAAIFAACQTAPSSMTAPTVKAVKAMSVPNGFRKGASNGKRPNHAKSGDNPVHYTMSAPANLMHGTMYQARSKPSPVVAPHPRRHAVQQSLLGTPPTKSRPIFATPAYADSPKADELPLPPLNWLINDMSMTDAPVATPKTNADKVDAIMRKLIPTK